MRSISGLFIYPLFPGSKDDENGARLGPRSSPSPIRSRDLRIVDTGCRIGRRDRRRASIASRASPTRARWGREKHARFSQFRDFPEICRRDGPATYADFCSLAAALVALTWATARTVVLAATANIFLRDDEVGCVNGVDNRKPEEEESREERGKLALGQSGSSLNPVSVPIRCSNLPKRDRISSQSKLAVKKIGLINYELNRGHSWTESPYDDHRRFRFI